MEVVIYTPAHKNGGLEKLVAKKKSVTITLASSPTTSQSLLQPGLQAMSVGGTPHPFFFFFFFAGLCGFGVSSLGAIPPLQQAIHQGLGPSAIGVLRDAREGRVHSPTRAVPKALAA